jgi:hypothetical protein
VTALPQHYEPAPDPRERAVRHLPLELRAQLAPFGIADNPRQPSLMNRWQYQRLLGRADDEALWDRLADQGLEGWELVSTLNTSDGVLLTLKRPIADD